MTLAEALPVGAARLIRSLAGTFTKVAGWQPVSGSRH